MNCKDFEKKIPAFISGDLSIKELKEFFAHIEACGECKEELSIQILVSESMLRLQDGDAFDLRNEINKHMEAARERIRRYDVARKISVIIGLTALVAVLILVIIFAF